MPKHRIVVSPERAALVVNGRVSSEHAGQDLDELLLVRVGWDVFANDETFYVLAFPKHVWVVPEDTPGVNTLLFDVWRPRLLQGRIYAVSALTVPWPWRKRLLFLPLPVPRLGCFPRSTLPEWLERKPVDFAALPPRVEPAEHA